MSIFRRIVVAAFAVSLASLFHPAAFAANQPGGQLGSLVCKSQPGTRVQFFLRSSVAIRCTFKTPSGQEKYKGEIGLLGIDLSQKSEETLYFTVVGVATNIKMGSHSLKGDYVGASISVSIVKEGVGSTQFVGGVNKSFSLVPSLDTFKGIGISIGVSRMKLLASK